MTLADVERWLEHIYIAADGATLRQEDRRKAGQLLAMLDELERAFRRVSRHSPLLLVDAAAGKSYLGLLAAKLLLEPSGRPARVLTLERDAARVAASERAAALLQARVEIRCRQADVSDASAWPSPEEGALIVVALHACGEAADAIIERTIASRARVLLLVPCCTTRAMPAAAAAAAEATRLRFPRQAPVRQRFVQAMVDADRTRRLEAAGYETEVVEFVGATVTPHNLLWRARLVPKGRQPRQ